MGGSAAPRTGRVTLPLDAVVSTDYWEVDLMPISAMIDEDPTSRPVVLMLGAGEYVLHMELLAHPPNRIDAMVDLLAKAVASGCESSGKRPSVVLVRHGILAELLEFMLEDPTHPAYGARCAVSQTLVRLDDALASLESSMGASRDAGAAPRISRVSSWAAWGLPSEAIGEFFAAAAEYHRAAPWRVLAGEDSLGITLRDGGAWDGVVMGAAGEVFGLALYEDPADVMRMYMPRAESDPSDTARRMRGTILSLGFEPRDETPKPMREEIKRAQWPVAGMMAHPMLQVLNSPGGALMQNDLLDLTAALRAIPAFVEKHAKALRGEAKLRYPLKYSERSSGVSVELVG